MMDPYERNLRRAMIVRRVSALRRSEMMVASWAAKRLTPSSEDDEQPDERFESVGDPDGDIVELPERI